MNDFHDEKEGRSAEAREAALFERFGERLSRAASALSGLGEHLAGHDLGAVDSREALARLPVLRKSALMAAQRERPPFGGFVDAEALAGSRVFVSPGPVFEPQRPVPDPWSAARALHAAGFGRGTLVHNAFSYHLTPGAFIVEEGARALGCTVFPAGTGGTAQQVAAIRQLRPRGFVGTPDYLRTLLDHAAEEGAPLESFEIALVSGGALFPAMRAGYRDAGIRVLQCYATADTGVIAYESATGGEPNPGMIVDEDLIVELCHPGSGEPVGPGERGEVIVTRLESAGERPVAPLVRFATGDLSMWLDEPSPCGRSNHRLAGWLGRADQRTKVRGQFVDPEQVQSLRREHPEIERLRLVVSRAGGRDAMTLRVRIGGEGGDGGGGRGGAGGDVSAPDALLERIGGSLSRLTGLSGTVEVVETLPADGIVVEDARDYDDEGREAGGRKASDEEASDEATSGEGGS